jgi:hypothetical protein
MVEQGYQQQFKTFCEAAILGALMAVNFKKASSKGTYMW